MSLIKKHTHKINKTSKTNQHKKPNQTKNSNRKERIDLEKIRDKCLKQNCGKLEKRSQILSKKSNKLVKQKCLKYDSEKYSMHDYFKCSNKVNNESGQSKAFQNVVKCNKKYCRKEQTDFMNDLDKKLHNLKNINKNTEHKQFKKIP